MRWRSDNIQEEQLSVASLKASNTGHLSPGYATPSYRIWILNQHLWRNKFSPIHGESCLNRSIRHLAESEIGACQSVGWFQVRITRGNPSKDDLVITNKIGSQTNPFATIRRLVLK